MKKVILLFFLIGFLSFCGVVLADEICFKDQCYQVEIADTNALRIKGLQNREHMDKDKGMLFTFPGSGVYAFWMKNTLISLDMIWIDYKRRVVDIAENVPPCEKDPCVVYRPKAEAMYVLELNAGEVSAGNIKIGDFARLNLSPDLIIKQ